MSGALNGGKKPVRFDSILRALEKGQRDAQLLDGRDHDDQYWRNAKRQLNTLRRQLAQVERENTALREVLDAQAAAGDPRRPA